MTTLFDCTRTIKPAAFGRGVLATRPTYRSEASHADRAWWTAETLGTDARDFDAEAGAAECVDRMGRGLAIL